MCSEKTETEQRNFDEDNSGGSLKEGPEEGLLP